MKEQYITVTKLTFIQKKQKLAEGRLISCSNEMGNTLPIEEGTSVIGNLHYDDEGFALALRNSYQKACVKTGEGKELPLEVLFTTDRFVLRKGNREERLSRKKRIVVVG